MKETLNPNEWIMMEALWAESPATLGETIARIGDKVNWSYKTYQSYMNILEKKGFVTAVKRGRDKFYSPAMSLEACTERESRAILSRMELSCCLTRQLLYPITAFCVCQQVFS